MHQLVPEQKIVHWFEEIAPLCSGTRGQGLQGAVLYKTIAPVEKDIDANKTTAFYACRFQENIDITEYLWERVSKPRRLFRRWSLGNILHPLWTVKNMYRGVGRTFLHDYHQLIKLMKISTCLICNSASPPDSPVEFITIGSTRLWIEIARQGKRLVGPRVEAIARQSASVEVVKGIIFRTWFTCRTSINISSYYEVSFFRIY